MAVTAISHDHARKRITILGSTGSVGCNTVDIVRRRPEGYEVAALTAHTNVDLLIRQALELRPKLAVIADPARYAALKAGLAGTNVAVAAGAEGLIEAAEVPADRVIAAIVGAAGLAPTLTAIRRGAVIGIANKECLVCAGDLVTAAAATSGAKLVPVDSEHSAIFQVFDFENADAVEKIILTASGGPFLRRERASLSRVTPAEAVAHPNWDMGAKISVDSATMMNKGLELIEAWHLFPVGEEQIEILIHPQSVVHSMVAYTDGSVLAQMGAPDMRTPIAYALDWPRRGPSPAARLDLARVGTLNFEAPDETRFPALALARAALKEGGGAPTVLNAANEIAVEGFLAGRIGFLDITGVVETVLTRVPRNRATTLAGTVALDAAARREAEAVIAALARTTRAG
ncbi:MAG TPA: 1-deoxy-D-xylulose-5-phosphate reductoisomerase [Alphaproteobacteria bacterium]|nr:1-deoxy-D-xylulose-5-phosphate reductoisomerase [Alphaproteobacteria bacterium]